MLLLMWLCTSVNWAHFSPLPILETFHCALWNSGSATCKILKAFTSLNIHFRSLLSRNPALHEDPASPLPSLLLCSLPCPHTTGGRGGRCLPAPMPSPPFSFPSPENSNFEVLASDYSTTPVCRSHLLPVPSLNFFNIFSFWFTAISS